MTLSDLISPERVREIAEQYMDPWPSRGPVNCCFEAITAAAPEIVRAALELAAKRCEHTMAFMQGLRISGHEHGTAEIHLYDDQIFNNCLLENVNVLVGRCVEEAVTHCNFVRCTITLDPTGPGRKAFRYCHFDEATTFSEPQPACASTVPQSAPPQTSQCEEPTESAGRPPQSPEP